jgi:hypothetical protein
MELVGDDLSIGKKLFDQSSVCFRHIDANSFDLLPTRDLRSIGSIAGSAVLIEGTAHAHFERPVHELARNLFDFTSEAIDPF